MTNYLADVVMPADPTPEETTENIVSDLPERDEPEDQISTDEEEEIIPEPEKKEKIPQEEIFKAPPKVQPVADLAKEEAPKKKKRVMSQKQLDALAEARQRGIATRRRKAEEKKKMKELEKEEKQLLKEQKVKRVRKLKEEVDGVVNTAAPPKEVQIVEKEKIVEKGYTQAQLDAAVAEAVEKSVNRVETLRKERKAKKKEAQAKEQHDAKVFKEINSALKNDVWAECFM
jgi:hypothetical protein